ncbi:hypothetical protein F4860DRAFT_501756 [Xylaria cubensis]|nr:hypothetical protein F4860DRAFT_501756 [Xylaria cubensis]
MAEAFGIAASVAGIVSLGLELFKGISTYIDAVRCCGEEISAIHRQVQTFQSSLSILKNSIPNLSSKHQAAGDTVLGALRAVELELQALHNFVEKLGSHSSQSQNLLLTTKRMTFVFHQQNLETLQKRLDRTNMSLDAATRGLGLVIISSIDQSSTNALSQLSLLSALSTSNSSVSSAVKTSLDTFIPQVNQDLVEIQNSLKIDLPTIQRDLASVSKAMLTYETNLTQRIQELRDDFRENVVNRPDQLDSLNSVIDTLAIASPAGAALDSELIGGAHRAAGILKDLAERKTSDPPHLLSATAEQRALYRLVSSPAQLEELCKLYHQGKEAEHEFTIEQRDKPTFGLEGTRSYLTSSNAIISRSIISTCICQPKRKTVRRRVKLGSLSFSTLSDRHWKHLPECRYANGEVFSESNSIGFSYSGLRWLFSKVIDVSMSLSMGAGGLSIGPNITIRPVVDERHAPVFCALYLVDSLMTEYKVNQWEPPQSALQFLELVCHRISRQYMSRKSSPFEVTISGRSALHVWVDLLNSFSRVWGMYGERFTTITKLLLGAGVPVSWCDDKGWSAGTQLLKYNPKSIFDLQGLVPILCQEAPEASVFQKFYYGGISAVSDWFVAIRCPRTARESMEIFDCGPLSVAVILGDEVKVKDMLALYPSTIYERNMVSQTPFHLATNNPRILRLLIASANSQELDFRDEGGDYALDYALRSSSLSCVNGSSWTICSKCPCIECVEILLVSKWRFRFDFLLYCDSDLSHAARLRIISHLVSEREALRVLAQSFLPLANIHRYRLKEPSVLDINAHIVAELLLQDGIKIPASIRTTLLPLLRYDDIVTNGYERWFCGDWDPLKATSYISVYHHTDAFRADISNRLAELLYDNGFHDVDQVDNNGHSPLSLSIWRCCNPLYVMWLIDHGADILLPFKAQDQNTFHEYIDTKWIAADFIPSRIFGYFAEFYPTKENRSGFGELQQSEVEAYRRLVSLVAPLDHHDECHCQCIQAGCHTMKMFFQMIWRMSKTTRDGDVSWECGLRGSDSILKIAEMISNFLRSLALDLSQWDRVTTLALRYFTFQVLDLRHTCCSMPWRECELSDDDIAEIEDENWVQLDLLEHLLRDFQVAYDGFESQSSQGDKFTSFLTVEWAPKMQQTLADQEAIQLTAYEKMEAERIGVRWQPEPEVQDKREYDRGNLEYWMKELDSIMPE